MRAIILTWEYPPRIIGEMANRVKALAEALVERNVEVHVVAFDDWRVGSEVENNVIVHRISNPVKTHTSILTWALTLNIEMERVAADIYYNTRGKVDVVHAHDWLCVPAALGLKHALQIPFVLTIHSTEDYRSHGSATPFNLAIKSIEWRGLYEAAKVIVHSQEMMNEVQLRYQVPETKIVVVPITAPLWIDKTLDVYSSARGGKNE
ncbi:glycosyltransferase [Candidatus Bathyarchaeota archaeon]|nr:glycosyltransferase [Candidatus Bathyarchaeota archaeon]